MDSRQERADRVIRAAEQGGERATGAAPLRRSEGSAVQPARRPLEFSDLAAYEWLNIPAWVYDAGQFRHWWANAAGLRFWRSSSLEELCSRSYVETSAATRSRLALSMEAHARGETTYERWTLFPRGVPTSILLQGTAICLPDRRIGILFMAELAMQIEPNVVRGIEALNHAGVLVAVHRASDGSALMRNRAAMLAFGPARPELVRNDFAGMFADPDLGRALLASAAGRPVESKAQLVAAGDKRWHLIAARHALDPVTGEPVVQFHAQDVSELMEAQSALDIAREKAEAAHRAKGVFLATMSHEIRTPINGLLGVLHLLDRTSQSAQQQRWVNMALKSGTALSSLITDVIELSDLDSGQLRPKHELLDVRAALESAVRPLEPEAARKGIALTSEVAADVPDRVVGDCRWLRQIVFNLVANAVRFTPRGFVRVRTTVSRPSDERLCLCVEVADSGLGIDSQDHDAIFKPFTQLDQSYTRQQGGCGMGLAIVRRMVDLLGGYVELDSAPGRGSRFRVLVPIA